MTLPIWYSYNGNSSKNRLGGSGIEIVNDIVNEKIRESEILLIDEEGNKLGVVKRDAAIAMAKDKGLDVILVAPNLSPPVAKILNYGQFRYEREKKQKESKKSGRASNVKKVLKFSLKIGVHDYNVRKRHGEEFLQKGFRVQAVVVFRGREMAHKELGVVLLDRFINDMEQFGAVEGRSTGDREISAVLVPVKKGEVKNAKKQD